MKYGLCISYKVLNKLNAIGLKPIKVHVRQKGTTLHNGYQNAEVRLYAMSCKCEKDSSEIWRKKTYEIKTISVHENGEIETFNHSVWITKENKVVCV